MKKALLIYSLWLGLAACSNCPDASCKHYAYQEKAQQDFDQQPNCYMKLDADGDSIVCEDLPSISSSLSSPAPGIQTDCPTTANCGCSNKRKAKCPSQCCQWIIREGCKCS